MLTICLFDNLFRSNWKRSWIFLSALILILAITSCSDPTLNNPFDPEVNTEFPAPTLISVDNFGLAKIQVKFSSDYEYFTKYQLERKTEQTSFTQVAEIPAEIIAFQTYIDSLINADTLYTYRVQGMADELPGPYSNTMSYSLAINPPVDVLAYAPDDHTISMSWYMSDSFRKQNMHGREEYEFGTAIERKINAGNFEEIVRLSSNITGYQDSTLSVNTDYTYRLRTYLNQSYSAYSTPFTMQTQIVNAPTQLTAEPLSDQQIELLWQDNCSFETGYRIERKEGTGDFNVIGQLEDNVTSFTDVGLLLSIDYTYRVQTFTDYNISDYSNEAGTSTFFPAPFNLTAEAITDQNIMLEWEYELPTGKNFIWVKDRENTYQKVAWDHSRFQQGFSILRREEAGDFEEIGTTAADELTFTDQGLLLGINYQYCVRAFTVLNFSDCSNMVWEQTFFPAPDELIGSALNDQSIELSWDDNCGFEDHYLIERSIDWCSYEEIAVLEANTDVFVDEGLLLNTLYSYRVRASTDLNNSNYSNEINEQTFFPAPDGLIGSSSIDDTIELTWNDNCTFEETYHLERSIDFDPYEVIAVLDANTNSFTDTGLLHGPQYFYRVRAGTSLNFSEYTLVDTTVTYFPPPSDLFAEPTSYESIELNWTDNCSFEDGYSVEIYEPGGYYEIAFVNSNTCNIIGLVYGTIYTFRVRAKHGTNYSYYSSEIDCPIELLAPSNLTIEVEDDQTLHILWTAIDSFEEGFSLERSTNGGTFEEIVITAFDVYQYWDYGLIYGNNYTYRVRSFANQYYSPYSNELSSGTSFPAPTNLSSELLSDTDVELTWQDNCNWEDGYSIERRDAGSSFVQIATVPTNNTTYTDDTVAYGLEYTYRVRAYTDINNSDYTNETSQLVEIEAPTGLTATAGTTSITLDWSDNTLIEENYEIERMITGEDFQLIATVSSNAETYTDTNVTNLVTYFYRVRAVTTNNQSEYSNIANATVVGE